MGLFGTSGSRQDTHAPERADDLADFELENHAGELKRLGDYWTDQPAVLVFLRHYG
jgi:peroxiredoxin